MLAAPAFCDCDGRVTVNLKARVLKPRQQCYREVTKAAKPMRLLLIASASWRFVPSLCQEVQSCTVSDKVHMVPCIHCHSDQDHLSSFAHRLAIATDFDHPLIPVRSGQSSLSSLFLCSSARLGKALSRH